MSTTTVQAAIDDYTATRRWSDKTARGCGYTLNGFALATGNPPIDQLTHEHVAAWWETRKGLAPSTARNRRSVVSNFLEWCRATGRMTHDPMAGIPVPKEPRRMPTVLDDEEVRQLLKAVPDARGFAIVVLMWTLGFRCVDVAQLQVHDVDFRRRMIRVTGKGGNEDVLPLPPFVARAIDRYLTDHPAPAGPLFRTHTDPPRPMSAQLVSDLLRDWMLDAGLKRHRHDGIGAHALRRTCATDLLDQGVSVRKVQAVMRHASLTSTERYLRRSDAEELRGILEGREPR